MNHYPMAAEVSAHSCVLSVFSDAYFFKSHLFSLVNFLLFFPFSGRVLSASFDRLEGT